MGICRWWTLWCKQGKEILRNLNFPRSSAPLFLSYLKTQNKGNVISCLESECWVLQGYQMGLWANSIWSEAFWHFLLIGHHKAKSEWILQCVSASLGEGRQLLWLSQLAHHATLISFKSNSYNCFSSRCFSDSGTTTATWEKPRLMKRQPDWKWKFGVS